MPPRPRRKKKEEEGAPAYFGLFCSLMTVMLAFFILMTTMAEEQESGFHNGIGDIRNAFGIRGGFGLFGYAHLVRGSATHQIPDEVASEEGLDASHQDTVAGQGGGGNTDLSTAPIETPRYLRIRVAAPYPGSGESFRNSELANFLQIAGTALALLDYQLTIKSYVTTESTPAENGTVAFEQATTIMRYLHSNCRVPYSRLQAAGYGSMPANGLPDGCPADEPALWIDVYQPARQSAETAP